MDDFGAGPSTSDDNGDNLPSGEKYKHLHANRIKITVIYFSCLKFKFIYILHVNLNSFTFYTNCCIMMTSVLGII